jgi:transposase, IS5 family
MKPQKINTAQSELFKTRLSNQLNPKDPLFILADQINWSFFENEFGALYTDGPGQPPKPVRLMVGLMLLQHMHGLSDEQVVHQWVQNPYWQYFCGYDYLQWELPSDPSSMTRWRNRLGEKNLEKILAETIVTAVKTETVSPQDLKRVIADTTVMEKNITFPTDSKLLNRAREQLVKLADECGLKLRQSYARVGKFAALNAGKYAHAKQFKRMRKEVKKLKNYLGRTVRDIERQIKDSLDLRVEFTDLLDKAKQLLSQEKKSKDKLYSLHAPKAYCISKGKAGKPYEFGCKVSLVLTHKQGLALSSQALHENQYDGHTLDSSLKKAEEIAQTSIEQAFVDKGYKGHGIEGKQVYISGQKRGMTRTLKKHLKRRSAIEPHIGHMKSEGKLRRNYLKGIIGDALNALLCAIGHNMRLIWRTIRSLFVLIWTYLFGNLEIKNDMKRALFAP